MALLRSIRALAPNSSRLHVHVPSRVISAEDKVDRLEACTALLPQVERDAQLREAAVAEPDAQREAAAVAAAEPGAQQEAAAVAAGEPDAQQEAAVAAAEPNAQQEAAVAAAEPNAQQEAV